MYKVVGADGKEYGPISLDQLKQWIAQGRVNAQTRVQEVGTTTWKTAADFPELFVMLSPSTPVAPPVVMPGPIPAAGAPGKTGLATASLVLGILSFFTCFLTGIPAIICGHIAYARARRAPGEYGGSGMALTGLIVGYVCLVLLLFVGVPAAILMPALSRAKARAQQINCMNNLKQIGVAFRVWALDHSDQYPFNVSTNLGGTLEVCALDADGFDQNAALHFMTLSNELMVTQVLICASDQAKQPAADFQQLQAINVSYQLRTGTNLTDSTPQLILAICPIHHNVLRCDGSVEAMTRERFERTLSLEPRNYPRSPAEKAPAP